MFERYTEKARRVIFFARYEASQFGSPYIETEHLLLGVIREDKALTNRFLRAPGAVEAIRKQIEEQTMVREKVSTSVDLPLSNENKRVLAYAAEEAALLSHKHIGTEHLLLGILREEKCFAAAILNEHGVRISSAREILRDSGEPLADRPSPGPGSWLHRYTASLTKEDVSVPLVGRSNEILRLTQVLGRATKNCAVLVGDDGVGKHSIVAGLANQIEEGDAPPFLANKTITALDLAGILSAAAAQPDAVSKHLPRWLTADQESVFFMDEMFEILARPAGPGTPDAAEVLKPLLLAKRIQCVGAATPRVYVRAMKRHRWLARCFSKIEVRPASEEETLQVLQGMKSYLETFHSVIYAEGVLDHAIRCTVDHVKDRQLPDKALDLVDEAAAYVKTHQPGLPEEIKELRKKIHHLKGRMESCIANHEFEKARLYSDDERKAREKLAALETKHQINPGLAGVVTREAIEAVLASWLGVPLETIRKSGGQPPKA